MHEHGAAAERLAALCQSRMSDSGLDDSNTVTSHDIVSRHDGQALDVRLSNEQPVKWVAVQLWQCEHRLSVRNRNRELHKAVPLELLAQGKLAADDELALCALDGEFPR